MVKSKYYYGILIMLLSLMTLLLIGCGKDEGYRMMQIYQVEGTATIDRENIGSMDAYVNLNLLSGDKVSVSPDSYVRLKVDDDKYILAEAGSVFSIFTTGSDKSGKTDIQLEKGAITVEVENKLSEDSSFEVTTPNSVMAVRGTVFRISTEVDADNKDITIVTIFDGTVTVQKRYEDGTLSEEKPVKNGEEAVIYEEASELVIVISDEIDIRTLPVETLNFLKTVIEDGTELSVTIEEIDEVIEEKIAESEFNEEEDTEDVGESTDVDVDNDEPAREETSTTDTTIGSSNSTFPTDTSTSTEKYTVTFQYQGKIFGTQEVEAGKNATKPKLMPAASGNWEFDFSTPIESDTVIEFK